MRRLLVLAALVAGCDWPSGTLPPTAAPIGYPEPAVPGTTSNLSWIVLARDGAPVATTVHLVLDSTARSIGMGLAAVMTEPLLDSLTITSDASGRAAAVLRFGDRAGHAAIHLFAPDIGLDDWLDYDLPAGVAVAMDVEPVQPVYVGDLAFVTWHVFDAVGQRVFGNPVLDVTDTTIAAFVDQDNVRAKSTGQTWVRGAAGAARDSTPLAVVPHGSFGTLSGGQWIVSPMNGYPLTIAFMPPGGLAGPRYTASRDTLAWGDGNAIRLRLPGGTVAVLAPTTLGFSTIGTPEWSADGQWLYFTATYADQRQEIWRIRPDGSSPTLVGPAASGTERDAMPAVNAAGTALAFSTNRTLAGGQPTLRIIRLPGGSTIYQGAAGTSPRFSPDGTRVAFLSGSQLMLVNADGTGLRRLTTLDQFVGQITWSPDSRWLLVRRGGSGGVPMYLHLVDTSNDTAIRLPYSLGWTEPEWY